MDRLPVDAVEFGIPVLVAHGFPDLLEGVDIQLALRRRESGLRERPSGQGHCQDAPPKEKAAFSNYTVNF
jgi:hypothetical protein